MLDPEILARVQFAFTMAFHIIFPSLTIGLASFLLVLEALWLRTGNDTYLSLYKFWTKIFALAFGMGVVSGIVMSYQFGTNWGPFAKLSGPIIGPLMAYEVLTAFFLEAGFLGVMLFGLNRVGPKLHITATGMVAVGTLFSAFWILSANSWMQTPAGYSIETGRLVVESWFDVVFNPSFPYRLVHMVLAAYLTTAFVVAGVGGWHLLRNRENAAARIMFSMAMWLITILAPLQILAGDMHGLNTLEQQPAKVAAMEGHFETSKGGTPLILFGWPDMKAGETRYAVEIPYLGSIILTHTLDGEIKGLNEFAPEDRPNATIVFWSFRIMVGLGVLMLLAGIGSLWARYRKTLFECRWLHRFAFIMGPSGFIAILAGWCTTEVGRQPWVIYGILRTADAGSPVSPVAIAGSTIAFFVAYAIVFGVGTAYILRAMRQDPRHAHIAAGEIYRADHAQIVDQLDSHKH
ncbi:cytochrome ubiquinol oxidase subunit I [Thalassospira marina]|uniref:Cytochrome ubiquinol oxidase subunit I n=1 Tax=Thalassospira marina TaxID=2048283 RepID=A0A2N3KY69_9PROT|nr:cytochrome ubiquinol oxidase subunit I [Thalassospira marina]AUG53399.1 cytochrome ubiquinol oxidase subunit I [Thalassospira marina]PKR55522.1 cytochrome ubiquinol oxidase subunit I [Thalassospira marina]